MIDALIDITENTNSPEFKIAAPLLNHIEVLHSGLPGWTEIRCIWPDKADKRATVCLWAKCTDEVTQAKNALQAAKANLMGYGIYIGVATRKASKDERHGGRIPDAEHIRALWVDLDGGSVDALMHFEPKASIILETGGGWHGYWMLKIAQYPKDMHRWVLRGLAKTFQADPKVAEFARVMRALGSYNTKPERNMARVIIRRWEPQVRYTIEDFAHLVEIDEPVVRSAEPLQRSVELPEDMGWIDYYLKTPPAEGKRNATLYKIASALKDEMWSEGDVLDKVGSFAGLQTEEIETTVHSAFKHAPQGRVVKGITDTRAAARG